MKTLKTAEYTNTTIFEINEECKAKFVSKKGSLTNRLNLLGKDNIDGTMWVYFWLTGKMLKPENPRMLPYSGTRSNPRQSVCFKKCIHNYPSRCSMPRKRRPIWQSK
jgi:hypothetical protein